MKKLMCLMACCLISSASFATSLTIVNHMEGVGAITPSVDAQCKETSQSWYVPSLGSIGSGSTANVSSSQITQYKPSSGCDYYQVQLSFGWNQTFTQNCPAFHNGMIGFGGSDGNHTLTLTGKGQCTWN